MDNRIFLVQGHSRTYEDDEFWPVAAYTDKAQADEHCRLAQAVADQIREVNDDDPRGSVNPYDPDRHPSEDHEWSIPSYMVVEVPLRQVAPPPGLPVTLPQPKPPYKWSPDTPPPLAEQLGSPEDPDRWMAPYKAT